MEAHPLCTSLQSDTVVAVPAFPGSSPILDFGTKSYVQLLFLPNEGHLSALCSLGLEDGVMQIMQNCPPNPFPCVLASLSVLNSPGVLSTWKGVYEPR